MRKKEMLNLIKNKQEKINSLDMLNMDLQIKLHDNIEEIAISLGIKVYDEKWWDNDYKKQITIIKNEIKCLHDRLADD